MGSNGILERLGAADVTNRVRLLHQQRSHIRLTDVADVTGTTVADTDIRLRLGETEQLAQIDQIVFAGRAVVDVKHSIQLIEGQRASHRQGRRNADASDKTQHRPAILGLQMKVTLRTGDLQQLVLRHVVEHPVR